MQAGRAVSRKRLIGQNRDKLTEKHQREQKRKVRHVACHKRRGHSVDEAEEKPGQANQVGLILPAEISGACKERRKERDL